MNTETQIDITRHDHRAVRTYIIGFGLSVLLTLAAFSLVGANTNSDGAFLSRPVLIGILMLLAIEQLIVQLVCFLHIDRESGPRWRLVAFLFAALVVVGVVAGSLWIMYNLNYNMMSSAQMDTYMMDQ